MSVARYFYRWIFLFVVGAMLGGSPNLCQAQVNELQARINDQISALALQGYQYATGGIIEAAARDDTKTIPVQMKAGPSYALVAVCSASCGHVELAVRDAKSVELAKSPEASPVAMVGGGLPADGAYEIRITIKQCSISSCGLAFAILEQVPPPAPVQNPDATVAAAPSESPATAPRDSTAEILESIISQLPSLIITTLEAERIRKQTKAAAAAAPVATEAFSAPGKPTGYQAQSAPQPVTASPPARATQRAGASQAQCQQVQQHYYAAVRTSGDPASIQNVIQLYSFLQCNCGFPRSPHVTQC